MIMNLDTCNVYVVTFDDDNYVSTQKNIQSFTESMSVHSRQISGVCGGFRTLATLEPNSANVKR